MQRSYTNICCRPLRNGSEALSSMRTKSSSIAKSRLGACLSELAVIPVLPGRGRPEAPDDLDRLERNLWSQVVDALPGHWIDLLPRVEPQRPADEATLGHEDHLVNNIDDVGGADAIIFDTSGVGAADPRTSPLALWRGGLSLRRPTPSHGCGRFGRGASLTRGPDSREATRERGVARSCVNRCATTLAAVP